MVQSVLLLIKQCSSWKPGPSVGDNESIDIAKATIKAGVPKAYRQ